MENFDSSQLLVIDGTDMIKQPWVWAQKAQVINDHLIKFKNLYKRHSSAYEKLLLSKISFSMKKLVITATCHQTIVPSIVSREFLSRDLSFYAKLSETKPAAKTMTQEFRDRLHAFYQSFTEVFQGQLALETPFDWNWSPAA